MSATLAGIYVIYVDPDLLGGGMWQIAPVAGSVFANASIFVTESTKWYKRRSNSPWLATRVTSLAAFIAGQRRAKRSEWTAHLAGAPEQGITLTASQKRRLVAHFLVAAVRMRLHDMAQPVWRPVDWVLRAQSRTNGFITAMVGAQAIYIVDDGGVRALVTEVWEPCGIAGAALFVLSRWLRRLRGIELATPEPKPTDE
ncbi:hypothetical protein [Streptomyces caniscabiei]|uniref:hypothetical protein n=1 Tax=Streptomyces caniscabiei TaxID=2746961 RepID=UPI0029B1E842|nr:hypothetical protein [Streptomyces caniscabiei]MDX3726845.1 hypothetical protein [Streptomyces caniscabiei]